MHWVSMTDEDIEQLKKLMPDSHAAKFVSLMDDDRELQDKYLAAAEKRHRDGELEIDEDAIVSLGGDPGAYVMAWIWVSNEEAGIPDEDEEPKQVGCPNCGCTLLNVHAVENILATVKFIGDDDHEVEDYADGDMEWDDESQTECTECDWYGPLKEAIAAKPEEAANGS